MTHEDKHFFLSTSLPDEAGLDFFDDFGHDSDLPLLGLGSLADGMALGTSLQMPSALTHPPGLPHPIEPPPPINLTIPPPPRTMPLVQPVAEGQLRRSLSRNELARNQRAQTSNEAGPRKSKADNAYLSEEDDEDWRPDRRPRDGPGAKNSKRTPRAAKPSGGRGRTPHGGKDDVPPPLLNPPPGFPGPGMLPGLAPPPFLGGPPGPSLLSHLPPPPANMIRGLRDTLPHLSGPSFSHADYVQGVLQRLEKSSPSSMSVENANLAGRIRTALRAMSSNLQDRDLMLHLLACHLAERLEPIRTAAAQANEGKGAADTAAGLDQAGPGDAPKPPAPGPPGDVPMDAETLNTYLKTAADVLQRWLGITGQ